jgi:hypothetical protein
MIQMPDLPELRTMTDSLLPQANSRSPGVEQRAAYRIEVQGAISASWAAWFEGASIEQRAGIVTIDTFVDQAALRGLLCRLWDLNLTLRSVNRAEAGAPTTGGTPHGRQR